MGLVAFYLIASKKEKAEKERKMREEFYRAEEDVLRPLGEEIGRFGRMGRMN